MRKQILGLGAAALVATGAFAADEDNTRVAAAANSPASFIKLDADADGRVSAIEATNDSKVAASFTAADADQDGYLTKAEFANLGKGRSSNLDQTPAAPQSDSSMPDSAAPAPR